MNDEVCAKCGAGEANWCPAWQVFLCAAHRFERTYKELDATEKPPQWSAMVMQPVTVLTL